MKPSRQHSMSLTGRFVAQRGGLSRARNRSASPAVHETGEEGSISPFMAILGLALIIVVGLGYDGGRIVASQSRARADASKAARAGAQQIDVDQLRVTGEPSLDASAAEEAAHAYLRRAGSRGTVMVEDAEITVTVTVVLPMLILPASDRVIVESQTASAVDGSVPP